MINQKIQSLTQNGLNKLLSNKDNTNIVVQVIGFNGYKKKTSKQDFFISNISDGKYKMKCIWSTECTALIEKSGNNFQNQIISIVKYAASIKNILVYKFQIICQAYCQVIGNPIPYQPEITENINKQYSQKNISILIDVNKIKKLNIKEQEPITTTKYMKSNQQQQSAKKTIKKRADLRHQIEFQEIADLYPNLENWRLYCRLTKKNYSEFLNKKKELTKILDLELMDRKSSVIKAAIFGEFGQKLNQQLQLNQVYTFSQGLVKIDAFSTKKNQKLSPYTIIFTERSKILLTIDDKSIKTRNNIKYSSISDVKNARVGQEVDVVAIIKQISDQITINPKSIRDTAALKKRTIIVCDPIQKVEIDVVFWNNLTNINLNLLYKTVVLSQFKIHEYNDTKSLNANFKSKMFPLTDHTFNSFQKQIQYIECQSLSYKRSLNEKNPKSIKEMEETKDRIKQDAPLWSYFRVYLNRIRQKALKKWYLGCPFCKKSIQQGDTSCISCKKTFQKGKNRYILQIQLSDSTGSIWTTAYDDFSEKIFKNLGNYPADVAKTLSQKQFEQLARKSYFQEFKIVIVTKYETSLDGTIRLKHSVAKLLPMNYVNEAKSNLQQIKNLI